MSDSKSDQDVLGLAHITPAEARVRRYIKVSPESWERWKAAAEELRCSRNTFVCALCDNAADSVLGTERR